MGETNESKNTVTESTEKGKSPAWVRDVVWVLIGVIIGIVVTWAVLTGAMSGSVKSLSSDASTTIEQTADTDELADNGDGDATGITTYQYAHTVLEGSDGDQARELMTSLVDRIANGSTYVQLQTGDDSYESYMYNTNGECFGETSDGSYLAVYRNDNKVVKYGDEAGAIAVGDDIEVMSIVRNAINATASNIDGVQLFDMEMSEDSENVVEYRMDFVGEDAIKSLYSSISDDFAQQMYDKLTTQALVSTSSDSDDTSEDSDSEESSELESETESESSESSDEEENNSVEWDPHLIICAILQTNEDKTEVTDGIFYCYYVYNNAEYTNWLMQGFVDIGDWKLDSAWYDTDYSEMDSNTFDEMMTTLTDNLSDLLDTYFEENESETSELDTESELEIIESEVESVESEVSSEEIETETVISE
jgi:hypothetical protein